MSFYDQENDRDRRLGAALRALPVPEHEATFWADLEADLDELGGRPRVALGGDPAEEPPVIATPAEVRTSAAATRRATPRRLRQPRAPKPRRRPARRTPEPRPRGRGGRRAGRRAGAAVVARTPRMPRPHRWAWRLLAGAVVVALAVGALAWWGGTDDDPVATGPGPTDALTTAVPPPLVGPVVAWTGQLVRTVVDGDDDATTTRWAATGEQDGATRLTEVDEDGEVDGADLGDDPSIGVRVALDDDGPVRTTGLAPVPLVEAGTAALLHRDEAELVAALAASGDPAVVGEVLEGRPVWRATLGAVELVVDQVLLVPLRRVERTGATARTELALTVAADPPATPPGLPPIDPADDPDPDPDPDADAGAWRPATTAEARLLTTGLPEGFAATAVAVADAAAGGGPEGAGANPTGRATQVVYRRGWEQVAVTVWATGPDAARWGDPFVLAGATPTPTPLTTGAMAGAVAQVVVQPGAPPHLWAVGPEHVVLVRGPLPAAGLLAVAAGLAPPG